jgi:hypothetical protein
MQTTYLERQYQCSDNTCEYQSASKTKKKLKRIASKLYSCAKNAKLISIGYCRPVDNNKPDHRKNTDDYYDDLLDSIKKLPKQYPICQAST